MNITNLRPPLWVDQHAPFSTMLDDLQQSPIIAIDTESNSLFAYQEQVCLIQFSTATTDYLVDPLTIKDITPLGNVFQDPNIEKIFHAAEYDILCLKRDFNFEFNNLFDTMVASRILGRENLGLGAIINEFYGIAVNKKYQRADWGMRPLKPKMLEYARMDTHFLIDVRNKLRPALEEKNRWALAQEDFNRLCKISVPKNDIEKERCWKVLGNHRLSNQQLAVLQALCDYREKRAKAANLPVFKILNNNILLAIAEAMPDDVEALYDVPGLSPKIIKRLGTKLVKLVKSGMQQKPYRRVSNHKRPDQSYIAKVEALRNWRKKTAQELGVLSDIVLPRDILYAIVNANPGSLDELNPVLADLPWRYEQFGNQILNALENSETPNNNFTAKY